MATTSKVSLYLLPCVSQVGAPMNTPTKCNTDNIILEVCVFMKKKNAYALKTPHVVLLTSHIPQFVLWQVHRQQDKLQGSQKSMETSH